MSDTKIRPPDYQNPSTERTLVAGLGLGRSADPDVERRNLLRERMDKKVAPYGGTRPAWWLDRYGPGRQSFRDSLLETAKASPKAVQGLAESARKKADGYAEQAQEALLDALAQALGREPSEAEFDAAQSSNRVR